MLKRKYPKTKYRILVKEWDDESRFYPQEKRHGGWSFMFINPPDQYIGVKKNIFLSFLRKDFPTRVGIAKEKVVDFLNKKYEIYKRSNPDKKYYI